jgi:hypothetical protein
MSVVHRTSPNALKVSLSRTLSELVGQWETQWKSLLAQDGPMHRWLKGGSTLACPSIL